ncbi:MAG: VanZ family protein [Deltaproteobacteria bacterium]|nr:VanZ family protein [Deltaproteobacteria bacterium]
MNEATSSASRERARRDRSSARDVALAWLPAALYMAIIWLVSSLEAPTFPTASFPLRDKGVHAVEYGVLGFLLAHACLRTFRDRAAIRVALFAVLAGVLWGVLDEIHQAFVPGRSADLLDLVADSVGIVVGTGARTLLHHLARRAEPRPA